MEDIWRKVGFSTNETNEKEEEAEEEEMVLSTVVEETINSEKISDNKDVEGISIRGFPLTPSQKRLKISYVGTISHKKWADTYINCLLFSIRVRISDGVISHNIDLYLWLSWIFFSFKCIIFFSTTSLNQQDDWLHLYNLQCFCDRSILQPSETYKKMWGKKRSWIS